MQGDSEKLGSESKASSEDDEPSIRRLRDQIAQQRCRLKRLEDELAEATARHRSDKKTHHETPTSRDPEGNGRWPLSSDEYQRYGRQMILPTIGINGRSA